MTFFNKLFTSRNKIFKSESNAEIQCKSDDCPRVELAEEQVRVLVFRECERRGRKLLFDSDAVEKVPVESVCRLRRPSDVVEVNSSHAYKYKKPCSEVTTLGEMVFGSVAISFKSGAVCKIHNIPTPKRLVFTTIIPTAVRCHNPPGSRRVSDCGATSSSDSKTSGCSSDSKLYRSSKKTASFSSSNNCSGLLSPCQESKKSMHSGLHRSPTSLKGLGSDVPDGCEDRLTSLCSLAAEQPSLPSPSSRLFPESCDVSMTCEDSMFQSSSSPSCSRRPSDGRSCTGGSFGSVQSLYGSFGSHCDSRSSSMSRNCTGGSLCSLRRRWNHSLEMSFCDEGEDSAVRVKTKLGIALVLSLSGSQQTELESFLLNHSLAMEQILDRLRCLIEDSYSRCDEFVHLTYTAFLITRASVMDLVKSRQYLAPRWLSNATTRAHVECLAVKNVARSRKIACGKEKFVDDFFNVLRLFEAKDTNFFVSTILTAVLTHNLSWVQSIIDKSLSQEERTDLINEKTVYNPLGAQMGDLCGMLGFPLKSTKVVLSGTDKENDALSSLLNVLSYFIRCNNVVENRYEAEFSSITTVPEKAQEENFDSGVDCEMRETVVAETQQCVVKRCFDSLIQSSCTTTRPKIIEEANKTDPLYPSLGGLLSIAEGLRTEFDTSVVNKNKNSVPEMSVNHKKGCVSRLSEDRFSGNCIGRLQNNAQEKPWSYQEDCLDGAKRDDLVGKLQNSVPQKLVNHREGCLDRLSEDKRLLGNVAQRLENNAHEKFGWCFKNRLPEDKCGNFVARLRNSEQPRDCCNSMQSHCAKTERSLYPDIEEIARLENVRLEDLSSARDRTMFVDDLLKKDNSVEKSPSPDEGYATLHAGSALGKEKSVIFVVGGAKAPVTLVTKASTINMEAESVTNRLQSKKRKRHDRSHTINIPVLLGAKILEQRSRTMENVSQECEPNDVAISLSEDEQKDAVTNYVDEFTELPMPCCQGPLSSLPLPVCSLFGEVSSSFSPYQVLQAVTQPPEALEQEIRKDLSQSMRTKVLSAEISEAVCVIGDLRSWSVNLHSTKRTTMGPKKGLSVASSQMVADMLESFSHMRSLGVTPDFCLQHLEKELQEMYTKSKAVAELLMTTDFCNLELLTRCLDVAVNDVPLLLSVATTHTPELADRYGITFS